jgi:hypothetical protein
MQCLTLTTRGGAQIMKDKDLSKSLQKFDDWIIYELNSNQMHIGTVAAPCKAKWDYQTVCNLYQNVADNYDTTPEYVLFDNAEINARKIAAVPRMISALHGLLNAIDNETLINVKLFESENEFDKERQSVVPLAEIDFALREAREALALALNDS